jgi:uncharacterized membrane protein YidH (DUF202 family)
MFLDLILKVEASEGVDSLLNAVNKVVINPIIIFIFSLGVVLFLFGIVKYLLNPSDENIVKESKNHMLWGLLGMLIMVSVFGIMNLIIKSIGA